MDTTQKDEERQRAEEFLGGIDQDARKRHVASMFCEWRAQDDPEQAAILLEQLRIWDDVYHSLKGR